MRSKTGIARRVVALGLAVWFGALSVSIELQHRHPAGCPAVAPHGCACDDGHLSGSRSPHPAGLSSQTARPGLTDQYPYCLACLFVKSCNQQAITWMACVPGFAPGAYTPSYDAGCRAFPLSLSRFPRAPPSPWI